MAEAHAHLTRPEMSPEVEYSVARLKRDQARAVAILEERELKAIQREKAAREREDAVTEREAAVNSLAPILDNLRGASAALAAALEQAK